MLKSTQGMIVTFLVVMNKSIPPRIFFQLLPRFPLTCAKNPVYYYCCAGVAQLVEQLIRNQQVAGSSPASSSKGRDNLCLLFFLFLKRITKFNMQQKISLRYGVRFCLLIRFFTQDHLLTIYECTTFPPSKLPIVFATFSCMESAAIL